MGNHRCLAFGKHRLECRKVHWLIKSRFVNIHINSYNFFVIVDIPVIHDKDFEFPFAWPNGKDMCSDKRNVISKRDTFAQQDYRKYDLCEEERQRKYLQELQDLNARRHTDFFTPSQKSPIALNRYDNFPADLAPKSAKSFHVSGVARALYDFHGKDARYLN